jgi:hypothetical protein
MRAVVTYIAIKLVVRLMINMLELTVVYLVARTLFSIVSKCARWSFDLVATLFRKAIMSARTAKNKAKKLATNLPPPPHRMQRSPLELELERDAVDNPVESEMSEPEDLAASMTMSAVG